MNRQHRRFSELRLATWLLATILMLPLGRLFAQSLDAFNPAPNGAVYAIAVQLDGQILLGGAFGAFGTTARPRLARVTAEGSLDPGFNPSPNGDIYAIAALPNGKILFTGNFTSLGVPPSGTTPCFGIACLNADGTPDNSFAPGAVLYAYSVVLQPDGKILLGGSFYTLGGQIRQYFGRLNADGSLDTSFLPSVNNTVTTLAIQADGKILLGGSFTQLNGATRNYLGRLNPDGTLDTTFNPGASHAVSTLLVQPDGKILVGGSFTNLGGEPVKYLGRLDTTGNVESTFAPTPDGSVSSLALQADGQILVGGSFNYVAGQPRSRLARLSTDGALDATFTPTANGTVHSLALQPDGQVLVGGAFTTLTGQTRNRIGRLNNTAPATQNLVYDNTTLTWQRGGSSPQFTRVSFELATNGTDWLRLGPANYTAAGWQVTDLTLPGSYAIRTRGFITGGQYNSSSWSELTTLGAGPVVIVDQPLSQRVNLGAPASFRALAAGTPPLVYQWRKNGQAIADATNASYLIASSATADAASYSVSVSNSFGEVLSRGATLTILHTNMPFTATQPAGPVLATTATLNGMSVPRGYPTVAWFEWGTNTSYGHTTPPVDVDNGTRTIRVSAPIEGLTTGGVYHYRLVASNAFSLAWGVDQCFTTGMQLATWGDYTQGYPSIPSGLSNIVAVASGHGHSLALRNDGTLLAWYSGFDTYPPDKIKIPSDLTNIATIAAGYSHNLALLEDGTVTSWGKYMFTSLPVTVPPGLTNVVAIAGGDSHSLALKNDGTVVAWGDNSSKQISVPAGLSNVIAIAAGSTHSLALKADGKVVAWGSSFGGSMTPPTSLSNVVAISAESWHNLALRADGTVVAWGDNSAGQASVPPGLSDVIAIATGFRHSLALKANSTLVAWGNPYYVTNLPANLSQVIAISSGDYHSLALTPINAAPRPLNTSVTGYPDQDLVIGLRAWDPNGDQLSYRIASLPADGTLYQYTDTGRGDLISLPNTPVSDPAGRVLFSPPPGVYGAPFTTLTAIANDGTFDSSPGLLTVNLVPPPAIQATAWVQSTNPGFALSFPGLSNASYTVLVSTNLLNWNWLGYATQTSAGQFYFLDSAATNQPKRFYRLRSP